MNTLAYKCGNCHGEHPTLNEVRDCFGLGAPATPAQVQAAQQPAQVIANNIWRKVNDVWCVQVANGATTGDTVTVTKKNGDTAEVVLGEFVGNGNTGFAMYRPAPKAKAPAEATGYAAEAKKGDVHVIDGTYYRIHVAQKSGHPYVAQAHIHEAASWGEDGTLVKPGVIEWEYKPGFLANLSADTLTTAAQAAAFGKLVGRCCFCSHAIDTPESTAVGYGPVCASKYGLPWGDAVQVVE
jgi:hypothetical protein